MKNGQSIAMKKEDSKFIQEKKKEIRKKIRSSALQIPVKELECKSRLIEQNLYKLPELIEAKTIHIYLSSFRSEVHTFSIIKHFMERHGKVIVPVVVNKETYELGHVELTSIDSLKKSSFKIWEPEGKNYTNPLDADIIIVPGVVFDMKGNRLGSGKGFYDRFLVTADMPKIALAYEFQILDSIPIKKTDIPVDIIISESRIIRTHR